MSNPQSKSLNKRISHLALAAAATLLASSALTSDAFAGDLENGRGLPTNGWEYFPTPGRDSHLTFEFSSGSLTITDSAGIDIYASGCRRGASANEAICVHEIGRSRLVVWGSSGDQSVEVSNDGSGGYVSLLSVNGGAGNDRIDFSRIENPTGRRFADGSDGSDKIFGSIADTTTTSDVLRGGSGDDQIISDYERGFEFAGGSGDGLYGDDGDDWLIAGKDADVLNGGSGYDHFIAGDGNDQIYAFDDAIDSISCGLGYDRVPAADVLDVPYMDSCEQVD